MPRRKRGHVAVQNKSKNAPITALAVACESIAAKHGQSIAKFEDRLHREGNLKGLDPNQEQVITGCLTTSDTQLLLWEKVLWKRQPFPDTYTDATFLQHMVVNAHVPTRHYWTVVLGAAAVTQQLSAVVAAAAVPAHLHGGSLSASTVLITCSVMLIVGYAICAALGRHLLGGTLKRGCRQCGLLTCGVYCLSPLLCTLTRTVSSDTVVALTVMLLIAHLFLHDYNFVNSVTDRLTGTVSLSAAVFAAVLMASQMPSDFDVFVQVLFSLEIFLLLPFMRRYIKAASTTAHVLTTMAMVAGSFALLAPLSPGLAVLFIATACFVAFVCPACLVSIHKFKANINGPWDEAVPQMPQLHSREGGPHLIAPLAQLQNRLTG